MAYSKKSITVSNGADYGTILKTMLGTVLENTTTISNVTVNTDTASVFDVSFTYYGAVIRIYNNSYNFFISVDGSTPVDIGDMDGFKDKKAYVNIIEHETCGLGVSLQAFNTDNYSEFYISFIPVTAIMSNGNVQNMLLVGYQKNNASTSQNRTWLPVFIPDYNLADYLICIPSINGLYSITVSETIGNAMDNTSSQAIASPIIIDSAIGEINELKVNNYPIYRIYVGKSHIKTNIPGQYEVIVGEHSFVHITKDCLVRFS